MSESYEPTPAELDAIETRLCADPISGLNARFTFALYRADFAGAAQAYIAGHPDFVGDADTLARGLKARQVIPLRRDLVYPPGTFRQ